MSPRDHRQDETPESRLRSMAMHFGIRLVEGRNFREAALEQMQINRPGFPPECYEAALDAALVRIDEEQVGVLARREKLIAEARELDMLNAVCAIRYFNRRHSGHSGEYGLGPINIVEALEDLYSHEQITEAVKRCDAMIDEAVGMGAGSWDHEPNIALLRIVFPGFSDRAMSLALDWGHTIYR